MAALSPRKLQPLIVQALREDAAWKDVTSASVLPRGTVIRAQIISKQAGIIAGIKVAMLAFMLRDSNIRLRQHIRSGKHVEAGARILTVEGPARSIFAAERAALNFLGHLSGIATLTHAFIQHTRGTKAKILDTRKTLPGMRLLEKYAVAAGGGANHRLDLSDQVLIKTNHLKALSARRQALSKQIQEMIAKAKKARPRRFVTIEVTGKQQLMAALQAKPDCILLDNWPVAAIRKAVKYRNATNKKVLLEASGGVTLANVRAIAKTSIDRISIGSLTHSAPSLDVSLRVISPR